MQSISAGSLWRRTSAMRSSAGTISASGAKRDAPRANEGDTSSTPIRLAGAISSDRLVVDADGSVEILIGGPQRERSAAILASEPGPVQPVLVPGDGAGLQGRALDETSARSVDGVVPEAGYRVLPLADLDRELPHRVRHT